MNSTGAEPETGTSAVADGLTGLVLRLEAALDGGPPLLPAGWPPELQPLPGTAAAVATSGSTRQPKWVCLSATAIRASAQASAARLGGTGPWLLALPTDHIAGLNVVIRSVLAGHLPLGRLPGSFTATSFLATLETNSGPPPSYVSLVPTQLARLLAPDADSAASALRTFEAVLVGGAPCPEELSTRAGELGIKLVQTYGAAETAGGCVYDGAPLDGTTVKLDNRGRIMVGGPILALGYAQSAADSFSDGFSTSDHERWFTTSDLGQFDSDGRLVVVGRADDVIICGGLKIVPQQIESIIKAIPGVADAVVVGLPDQAWGQTPAALIVTKPGVSIGPERIGQAVRDQAGPTAIPRQIVTVPALPMLRSGKVDRAAAALLARRGR